MMYDDATRRWVPAGSDVAHLSRVHIYHNPAANTFRVVGRKLQADQQVVINCSIVKGTKYNEATPNFHQWRDAKLVWGLNFGSKEDATAFAASMMQALDSLSGSGSPQNGPSPQQLEQQRRLEQQKQEQLARENRKPDPPAPPPPHTAEMSAILARRRKAADKPAAAKEEPSNEECGSSGSKSSEAAELSQPKETSASASRSKSFSTTQKECPSPRSSPSPSSNSAPLLRSKVKKSSEGPEGDADLEQIKQEIIEEVKKELHKLKEEIISALIQELHKGTLPS
uniref:Vasodilator-stimulated phosphoprotein n=1 Tax=Nothobranchius kadleci TaxID=1051664 RepID=A0A1A8BJI4_NOTKA